MQNKFYQNPKWILSESEKAKQILIGYKTNLIESKTDSTRIREGKNGF